MRLFIVATPLTDKILWLLNKRLRGEITKERRLSPHKKNNKIFPNFESIYLNQTKAAADAQKFLLDDIFFSRGFQMRKKIPTSGHH
jgi:hypothetical protein